MYRRLQSLLFVSALLAVGCGGSGRSGVAGALTSVTVDWPTRGRDIAGPSSALSCQFTLQPVNFKANQVVISGNRPSGASAVNSVYAATVKAKPGLWNLTGNFFPVAGGFGTPVGTVSQNVQIQKNGSLTMPDGTALNIAFTPVIASAQVSPNEVVMVGGSTVLSATAYDVNNDVIVVTPGSFTYAMAGGQSDLSVVASGLATGIAIGSGSVTASIDGITSQPQSVAVSPAFRTIPIDSSDITYDPLRDTIWVATAFSASAYALHVVPINATTGAIGTPIALNDFPTYLAVTNDSNYLYVAGISGTLERVVLATGVVDQTIALPIGDVAIQVTPVPGTQNSVAVALVSEADDMTDEGTVIYDGATARANAPTIGQSIAFNDTGARIYGFQQFQTSGSLYSTANVDLTGISGVASQVTALQGAGNRIHWINGKILGDDGSILSPDSGALIGSLAFAAPTQVAAPVPSTNLTYYATWSPSQIQEYDVGAQSSVFSSPLGGIPPSTVAKAIYLGVGRVAFITAGAGTTNEGVDLDGTYIVRGLPN